MDVFRQLSHRIGAGWINAWEFDFPYGREPEPDDPIFNGGSGSNDGIRHQRLKRYAHAWLKSIGGKDVRYEVPWSGGKADVASRYLGIAVECGSMAASKVWRFLADEGGPHLVVLPIVGRALYFNRGEMWDMVDAVEWDEHFRREKRLLAVMERMRPYSAA